MRSKKSAIDEQLLQRETSETESAQTSAEQSAKESAEREEAAQTVAEFASVGQTKVDDTEQSVNEQSEGEQSEQIQDEEALDETVLDETASEEQSDEQAGEERGSANDVEKSDDTAQSLPYSAADIGDDEEIIELTEEVDPDELAALNAEEQGAAVDGAEHEAQSVSDDEWAEDPSEYDLPVDKIAPEVRATSEATPLRRAVNTDRGYVDVKSLPKAERAQFRREQQAALRELDKLREQIKRGKLPSSAPTARPKQMGSCYGEVLPYEGGFPVYLRKYVVMTGEQTRVALRFFNASDILVTGMRFYLTEKDDKGKVVAVSRLERDELFAERGTEFAVADAEVDPACVKVEVRVERIISGDYEYVVDEGGEVTLRYGVQGKADVTYFKDARSCTVKRLPRGIYMLLTLLAVLCATATALLSAWGMGFFPVVDNGSDEEYVDEYDDGYYDDDWDWNYDYSGGSFTDVADGINCGDGYVEA